MLPLSSRWAHHMCHFGSLVHMGRPRIDRFACSKVEDFNYQILFVLNYCTGDILIVMALSAVCMLQESPLCLWQ